jgi:hypothetical protein
MKPPSLDEVRATAPVEEGALGTEERVGACEPQAVTTTRSRVPNRSTWSVDPEGDSRFSSSPTLRQALNLEPLTDVTIDDPTNPRGRFQTAVRDILTSRYGTASAENDLAAHVARFVQGTNEGQYLNKNGNPSVSEYISVELGAKASRKMPYGKGVWTTAETSRSLDTSRVDTPRIRQPRTIKSLELKEEEYALRRLAATGITVPVIAAVINEAIGAETKTPIDIHEDHLKQALNSFPQSTTRGVDDALKARIKQKLLKRTELSRTGRSPAHALGLTEDDFAEIARATKRPLKIVKSRADAILQHIRAVKYSLD